MNIRFCTACGLAVLMSKEASGLDTPTCLRCLEYGTKLNVRFQDGDKIVLRTPEEEISADEYDLSDSLRGDWIIKRSDGGVGWIGETEE